MEKFRHVRRKQTSTTNNLRLVILEHALSEGNLCMPILTPFYLSIGLNYAEITLTQAIFTIAVLFLDVPMGYLADRFSRKWANVLGDLGCALFHFYYAAATNFWMVVTAEIGLGVACALTSGVDATLLRHFIIKDGGDENIYKKAHARMIFYGNAAALVLVLLGGPIGAINLRLAIFLSGVPRLFAGIVGILVADDSVHLKKRKQNTFHDMFQITLQSLKNPSLRVRIFAYAVIREMSHPIIWILTPVLLQAGIPLAIVSVAWAIDSLMRTFGSILAEKFASRLNSFQEIMVPFVALTASVVTLALYISPLTVPVYLLSGLACGWTGAVLIPLVQAKAPTSEQTTVISVAKTLARLLYIPAVYLVGLAADISLNLACGVIAIIFVPLGFIVTLKLR